MNHPSSSSRRSLTALVAAAGLALASLLGALPAAADVYTTPGEHHVNGRDWRTSCEAYSSTINRCSTEIKVGGSWVHNNLTYLPVPRSWWGDNPMAHNGEWVDSIGYEWRTECDTAATGRGACRVYIWDGFKFVMNNIVLFGSGDCYELAWIPLSGECSSVDG